MNKVLFSSNKDDWETPDDLFYALNYEFGFTLDAAAYPGNAKLLNFFCEDHWYRSQAGAGDTLERPWYGRVWLNPPYGRGISVWIKKARDEALWHAQTVVCLVPARTDTAWWHAYVWDTARNRPRDGVEVRLLKGRLKFKGAPASAPFPSAVIVFRSAVYRPEA